MWSHACQPDNFSCFCIATFILSVCIITIMWEDGIAAITLSAWFMIWEVMAVEMIIRAFILHYVIWVKTTFCHTNRNLSLVKRLESFVQVVCREHFYNLNLLINWYSFQIDAVVSCNVMFNYFKVFDFLMANFTILNCISVRVWLKLVIIHLRQNTFHQMSLIWIF